MLIAKLSIDNRGRIQLPSTFVKANDWNPNGKVLLKNHTNKNKVSLEYCRVKEPVIQEQSQEDKERELENKRIEELRAKVGLH